MFLLKVIVSPVKFYDLGSSLFRGSLNRPDRSDLYRIYIPYFCKTLQMHLFSRVCEHFEILFLKFCLISFIPIYSHSAGPQEQR